MNKIRVAIVEDEGDIREAMRVLINGSAGFACEYAYSNGEEAIEKVPATDVDIVIMDINLPGIDGINCMNSLKKILPHVQFMMCTVFDDDENIFKALESGATGYILKRTSPAQILEAIRELHSGGAPMSSEIARKVVESIKRKNNFSPQIEILTTREKEILEYLSQGYLYKEIAEKLLISKETVKKHIHNVYEKLQVQTRTEALNKAYRV